MSPPNRATGTATGYVVSQTSWRTAIDRSFGSLHALRNLHITPNVPDVPTEVASTYQRTFDVS